MSHTRFYTLVGFCAWFMIIRVAAAQTPPDSDSTLYPMERAVCPDELLRACCEDYCRKPQPCVCFHCFARTSDCYCCKPMPHIGCYKGSCLSDCYCEKPFPDLCRAIWADYFRCVVNPGDCMRTQASDSDTDCPSPLSAVDDPDNEDVDPPTPPNWRRRSN